MSEDTPMLDAAAPPPRQHGHGSQYTNNSGPQNNNLGSGAIYNAPVYNAQSININGAQKTGLLADLRNTNPSHDKDRIEADKGGLLSECYSWILAHPSFAQWRNADGAQLLWVRGDPGKGKTMLLCGIINELESRSQIRPVYFFCQATDAHLNNATAVLRGLLFLLLKNSPIPTFLCEEYQHTGKDLFSGRNSWEALCKILVRILSEPEHGFANIVLVIDALDECTNDRDKLLEFIVKLSSTCSKVIASSRNWPDIAEFLASTDQTRKPSQAIHLEVNQTAVSDAVMRYINCKVDRLTRAKKYDLALRQEVNNHLIQKCNDTFLWVSLVAEQLNKVTKRHTRATLNIFPSGLNALYERMLGQALASADAEACKKILAVVSAVHRPIKLLELISLTDSLKEFIDDMGSLKEIIGNCGSLLTLGIKDDVVYFVHQSAKDFLMKDALHYIMPSGFGPEHNCILSTSLRAMSSTLQRHLYRLVAEVQAIKNPDTDPLASLRYACVYWVRHLGSEFSTESEYKQVYSFLTRHYLHWLVVMSLLGNIPEAITCISRLKALIQDSTSLPELQVFAHDALRFVRYHCAGIASDPLQAYAALVFTPRESIVRRCFEREEPSWLIRKPIVDDKWNACLQTLENKTKWTHSVAFSPNGALLASVGVTDNVHLIKMWDVATGQCLQTLEGHHDEIETTAFCPDSLTLASGSWDKTIRVWNSMTGVCLHVLDGHTNHVKSVAYSPDGVLLASGSSDGTVKIWDATTGDCLHTIVCPADAMGAKFVAFSKDGAHLAYGMDRKYVSIWNRGTGDLRQIVAHDDRLLSLAFRDNAHVMSASHGGAVKVWDIRTNSVLSMTKSDGTGHFAIEFSRDMATFATNGNWSQINLKDVRTGNIRGVLGGHTNEASALAFSPDDNMLASSADDGSVRIWDITAASTLDAKSPIRSQSILSVAFSPGGDRLASVSFSGTKVLDTHTGKQLGTFRSFGDRMQTAAVRFYGEDIWVAIYDINEARVEIWDVTNDTYLKYFYPEDDVAGLAFYEGGSLLAISSQSSTLHVWDFDRDFLFGWKTPYELEPHEIQYMKFSSTGSELLFVSSGFDTIAFKKKSPLPSNELPEAVIEQMDIQGYSIQGDDAWIRKDGEGIIWLPQEYRSWAFATKGSMMAVGCRSGHIMFLEFA